MASDVDICNRALQKLGQSKITSLADNTKAARECSLAYEPVRDSEFRDHSWNSVIRRASLAALATAPAWGFGNAFTVPADFLRVLDVNGGWPWEVEGRQILTDAGAPLEIRYVAQITDVGQYDPLLIEAVASRLAAELAETLTQSNSKKEFAEAAYARVVITARNRNALEGSPVKSSRGSWLESRH